MIENGFVYSVTKFYNFVHKMIKNSCYNRLVPQREPHPLGIISPFKKRNSLLKPLKKKNSRLCAAVFLFCIWMLIIFFVKTLEKNVIIYYSI